MWYFLLFLLHREDQLTLAPLEIVFCFCVWRNVRRKNVRQTKPPAETRLRETFQQTKHFHEACKDEEWENIWGAATCCRNEETVVAVLSRVQISFKISLSAAEIKLDLKMSSRKETTDLCFK